MCGGLGTRQFCIGRGDKGRHMVQETIVVSERNSALAKMGGIIITAVETYSDRAKLVVGRPGLPNVESTLSVGSAVLFETPDGLFEVRVMSTSQVIRVTVLLTQVSPRPGIAGGFVDQNSDNDPFSPPELARIAASVQQIKQAMSERSDVSTSQIDFIARKLDDMRGASERMGRKDWMNLALGTMTSVIVTAAFTPDVAKAFLQAAGVALSWLFGGGMKLLP
jgi:hypothetical protein